MKLVAWNLGHQTLERPIQDGVVAVVQKLAPDVLTLNEYVHGQTRALFLDALASIGLMHILVSERVNTNNQVLIASRYPLS